MISKTIRKNIETFEWEHDVSYKNGFIQHWSPGIISNDNIYNDVRPLRPIKRNDTNVIISNDGWNYKDIEYPLEKINTTLANKEFNEF